MEELRSIALRLWERAGRKPSTPADLEGILVFQFRWFRPSEGPNVVQSLLDHGLFRPVPPGERVELDPTLQGLAVPIAYRPPEAFHLPPPGLALEERILDALVRATGSTSEELSAEVGRCARRAGVNRPVAALLVARARGVELPELAREAEGTLREDRRPASPPLSPSQTT